MASRLFLARQLLVPLLRRADTTTRSWLMELRGKGDAKWQTLEHNGPLFPPPYKPLPSRVALTYQGRAIPLQPAAEEAAVLYAQILHLEHALNDTFNRNFMASWRGTMTTAERALIENLRDCDFASITAHLAAMRAAGTQIDKAARLALEAQTKEHYGFALLDKRRQKVGNFRIEPPGLFRGRGEHPKMGMLKGRVQPEDVTVNVSDITKAPVPPPDHKWKEVRSDNTVSWLAAWTDTIAGSPKYVLLASTSKLKGRSDQLKFNTAHYLSQHIDHVRRFECLPRPSLEVLKQCISLTKAAHSLWIPQPIYEGSLFAGCKNSAAGDMCLSVRQGTTSNSHCLVLLSALHLATLKLFQCLIGHLLDSWPCALALPRKITPRKPTQLAAPPSVLSIYVSFYSGDTFFFNKTYLRDTKMERRIKKRGDLAFFCYFLHMFWTFASTVELILFYRKGLHADNVVQLAFVGKDFVTYENKIAVDPRVWQNLQAFSAGQPAGSPLFNDINVGFFGIVVYVAFASTVLCCYRMCFAV